jgi:hypothetical protein
MGGVVLGLLGRTRTLHRPTHVSTPADPTSFSQAKTDKLLTAVAATDPQAANEIAQQVASGELTLGQIVPAPAGALGASDSDTIGLNSGGSFEAQVVALKHEYEHVKNCKSAGTQTDPTTDSSNPCGGFNHAQMTAEAADDLCDFTEIVSEAERERICNEIAGMKKSTEKQYASSSPLLCPEDPPPLSELLAPCPGCQ